MSNSNGPEQESKQIDRLDEANFSRGHITKGGTASKLDSVTPTDSETPNFKDLELPPAPANTLKTVQEKEGVRRASQKEMLEESKEQFDSPEAIIKKGVHLFQRKDAAGKETHLEGNRKRSTLGRLFSALVNNPVSNCLGTLTGTCFRYTAVPLSRLVWSVAGKHILRASWTIASVPINLVLHGNDQAQHNSKLRKTVSFFNRTVFKPISSLVLKTVSLGTSIVSKALYLSMEGWAPSKQFAACNQLRPTAVRWLAKGLFTGISVAGLGILAAGTAGAVAGLAGVALPFAVPGFGAALTYGLLYAPTVAAFAVRAVAFCSTNDFKNAQINRQKYQQSSRWEKLSQQVRYRLCNAFDKAMGEESAFSYVITKDQGSRVSIQKKPTSSETYRYVCDELKRRYGSDGVEGLARLALTRAEEEQHKKIEASLVTNSEPEYISRAYVVDTIASELYRSYELKPHPRMFYANGELTIRAYETISSMLHALEPPGYKDLLEKKDERVIAGLMGDAPEDQSRPVRVLDSLVSGIYTSPPSRYLRGVFRRVMGDVDRKTYLHQLSKTVGKGIFRAHGEIREGDNETRRAKRRHEVRALSLSPRYRKQLFARLREGVGRALPEPGAFCEPEIEGYSVPTLERKDFKPGPAQLLIASGRMIGGWPIPVIGSMLGAGVSTAGYLLRATGKNLMTADELGSWISVKGLSELKLEMDAYIYQSETAGEAVSNSLKVAKKVVSLCQSAVEPFSENMGRSFIEIIIANTPLVAQYQMNDMRDQVSKATFLDLEDVVNHLDPVPDYSGDSKEAQERAAALLSKAEAFLKEFGDDIVENDHDGTQERTVFHYFSSIVRRPRRLMIALARAIEKTGNQTQEAKDLIEGLRLHVEKASAERINKGFDASQRGLDIAIDWVNKQWDVPVETPESEEIDR